MPIYVYECRECGQRFESLRSMSRRTEAPPCPTCDSEDTALGVSAPFVSGGGGGGGSARSCSTWSGGG